MATRIVVVSDTHCATWAEVHPGIRRAVAEADVAVHCGDITRMDVVAGMRRAAKKAVIVHGNADPPELRKALPSVEILELGGRRIGITHPAWGGPAFELEELLPDFPTAGPQGNDGPLDAVLFGHLHETITEEWDGVLYLNPGQGYASFMVPATIAVLTVDGGALSAEIRVVEAAR